MDQHGKGDEASTTKSTELENFQVRVKLRQLTAIVEKSYQDTNHELVMKLLETQKLCRWLKQEIVTLQKENFKLILDLNSTNSSILFDDEGERAAVNVKIGFYFLIHFVRFCRLMDTLSQRDDAPVNSDISHPCHPVELDIAK